MSVSKKRKSKREREESVLLDIRKIAEEQHETSPTGFSLPMVRIGGDPRDIRIFTTECISALMHWLRFDEGWFTILCNLTPCALCRARYSPTEVLLLPVLDAVEREIGILSIPQDRRPGSLLRVLTPFLCDENIGSLLEVSRLRSKRYEITQLAGSDLDLGDDVIRKFLAITENMSAADLKTLYRGVYQTASNQEILRDFPEVKTRILHREPKLDLTKL